MNRSYILSQNKENEPYPTQKSPYRLKINYQKDRFELLNDRPSKSPLKEQPLNRISNLYNENNNMSRSPIRQRSSKNLTPKNNYIQESDLRQIYSNEFKYKRPEIQQRSYDRNLSSVSSLSKIRPISIVPASKIQQALPTPKIFKQNNDNVSSSYKNLRKRQMSKDFQIRKDQSFELNYNPSVKSTHLRQRSKQLQFSAKVNNLQKINNQISNLLSYAYNGKSVSNKKQTDMQPIKSKYIYDGFTENSKSYQRKLSNLQKPQQYEPHITRFDPCQNKEDLSFQQNLNIKEDKLQKRKYEYFNYEVERKKKSPTKDFLQVSEQKNYQNKNKYQKQKQMKTPKSYNRKSPMFKEMIQSPSRKNLIVPFPSSKSQQITPLNLNPSQSQQKFSNVTINKNPDLQFYYESLKKRDQQISQFKKKLLNDPKERSFNIKQNKNESQYLFEGNSLTEKYLLPLNRKRNIHQRNQKQENSQKNPLFITQDEIQVYKDMNRKNQSNKTFQNNRDTNNELQTFSKRNKIVCDRNTKNISEVIKTRNIQVNPPLQIATPKSTSNQYQCQKPLSLTLKLDEQIRKIKNELKDCKKQKRNLRQKYQKILENDQKNVQDKVQPSFNYQRVQRNLYKDQITLQRNIRHQQHKITQQFQPKQNLNFKIHYENEQENHERMYDQDQQSNKKFRFAPELIQDYNHKDNNSSIRCNEKQLLEIEKKSNTELQCYRDMVAQKINDQNKKERNQYSNKQHNDFLQFLRKPANPSSLKSPKNFQIQLKPIQITKPQMTKLSIFLSQKIQIDFKLRQCRQNFMKIQNQNKWFQLKQHLRKIYDINKTQQQWTKLLSISPEEHNPFLNLEKSKINSLSSNRKQDTKNSPQSNLSASEQFEVIKSIAALIDESQVHFKKNLLHKFSSKKFKQQHFRFSQLDLSSKGYLSLEDLICFINLHSGKFYRNRDIIFMIKWILLDYSDQNDLSHQSINKELSSLSQRQKSSLCYSSQRGSCNYKLSYQFLWKLFTEQVEA